MVSLFTLVVIGWLAGTTIYGQTNFPKDCVKERMPNEQENMAVQLKSCQYHDHNWSRNSESARSKHVSTQLYRRILAMAVQAHTPGAPSEQTKLCWDVHQYHFLGWLATTHSHLGNVV